MSPKQKKLVVIGGPTGSGKSSLAIRLAKVLSCPVVSADSRQVYAELNIGTAKVTPCEMEGVHHYLLGHRSIHVPYSVGDYETDAMAILSELYTVHDVVILVGGTGLYIKAVLQGIDDIPAVDPQVTAMYEQLFMERGLLFLQAELMTIDPEYAKSVDLENPRRIIRALGVARVSGKAFSHYRKQTEKSRPFDAICLALRPDRAELYNNIEHRVDEMIKNGLIEECRALYPYKHLRSLQTVGYQEIFAYFDGKLSLEQAVAKIKQHSRNYAKRQGTWFNNQGNWQYFQSSLDPTIISDILSHLALS